MRIERRFLPFFIVFLIPLVLSACTGASTPVEGEVLPPKVFVTFYVTPIIATPAPITPQPPAAETKPAAPTAFDPNSPWNAPVHFPGPGCSASRLYPEDRAFVAAIGEFSRVYKTKQIQFDPGVRDLVPGEEMTILYGPLCDEDWLFWFVELDADELQGFVPEGNGNVYYLLPAPPLEVE
jgi:hypothetical protein